MNLTKKQLEELTRLAWTADWYAQRAGQFQVEASANTQAMLDILLSGSLAGQSCPESMGLLTPQSIRQILKSG
jgi:hypothetical protein